MPPWFIATRPFTPEDGEAWESYVAFSGLVQLEEVVSLGLLCPTLVREIKNEYWDHIVNEDFMLNFFVDFDSLMAQVRGIAKKNVLCVFRNPPAPPTPPACADFEFLGYDLVGTHGSISPPTNCGGFPDVFANAELSRAGRLHGFDRAVEVQRCDAPVFRGA